MLERLGPGRRGTYGGLPVANRRFRFTRGGVRPCNELMDDGLFGETLEGLRTDSNGFFVVSVLPAVDFREKDLAPRRSLRVVLAGAEFFRGLNGIGLAAQLQEREATVSRDVSIFPRRSGCDLQQLIEPLRLIQSGRVGAFDAEVGRCCRGVGNEGKGFV